MINLLFFHKITADKFSCSQHILNQTKEQEIRNQRISVVSEMDTGTHHAPSTETTVFIVVFVIGLISVLACVAMSSRGGRCCEPRHRIYVNSNCGPPGCH